MSRRAALGCAGAALVVAGGAFAVHHFLTANRGAVQRGFDTAARRGCFACHGPGGVTGLPDAGEGIGEVPPFSQEEVRAYAENEGEIREWILDGMPRRLRQELAPDEPAPLLEMPRWRAVLSAREVDDLVAYVKAVSDYDPMPEGDAAEGRQAARARGCFACHGPQGRGSPPNPGSLKGYIPSWDGDDFPELARDDAEIREWILDGSPARLRSNPLAAFFLERQVNKMPKYRGHLDDEEVGRIVAYIRWLRASRRDR